MTDYNFVDVPLGCGHPNANGLSFLTSNIIALFYRLLYDMDGFNSRERDRDQPMTWKRCFRVRLALLLSVTLAAEVLWWQKVGLMRSLPLRKRAPYIYSTTFCTVSIHLETGWISYFNTLQFSLHHTTNRFQFLRSVQKQRSQPNLWSYPCRSCWCSFSRCCSLWKESEAYVSSNGSRICYGFEWTCCIFTESKWD